MTYLLPLTIGLGIIWLAIKIKEEVLGISIAIVGSLITIWAFALSPTPFKVLIEVIGIVSVFSFCVRCWDCQ